MKLTERERRKLYGMIMESIGELVANRIYELSTNTVRDAAEKVTVKSTLLRGDNGEVDEEKLEAYLKSQDNPAYVRRIRKLYKDGLLKKHIIRQQHILGTMANVDLEWFREHFDEYKVPLSPEFIQGDEKAFGMKTTDRKPTKDEHDFYRFFISEGTDIEGMKPEDIKRYRKAWRAFYIDTLGIDPLKA